jgi:hypothetical protein
MFPVALGLGANPSLGSPIASAAIGGLMSSIFLRLLVIPSVFTYVDAMLNGRRGLVRYSDARAAGLCPQGWRQPHGAKGRGTRQGHPDTRVLLKSPRVDGFSYSLGTTTSLYL